MAEKGAVYMRPRDDSYQSFRAFFMNFANSVGGAPVSGELSDADEREMKKTYAAFLKARKASGEPLVNADEMPEG